MTIAATPTTSRKSILVIDDSELCRELTADCLRAQGFNTLEATDGVAALRQLERNRVDLIVLDNEMPGMNGLDFLKALRATPARSALPVIMLTATTSKEAVVEAMRLGVKGYLLKSRFTMPEMIARIRTALNSEAAQHVLTSTTATANPPARLATARPNPTSGPAEFQGTADATSRLPARAKPVVKPQPAFVAPNLVTRAAMIKAIEDSSNTKTLAGVVAAVVALSNSPHAGLHDLSGILRQDPVLSSRVVQLACSVAYAGNKARLATIDDAVRVVGASAIRELALTVGIFDSFPAGRADGIDLLRCWQHAFGAAAAMNRIVPRSDTIPPGTAHLIGLCNDLGEIMVRQRFPGEYAAAVDFARQMNAPVSNHFAAIFGMSNAEVVEMLLAKMKLPALISEPILEFARRPRSPADAHASVLARSLAIATFFAHGLGLTSSSEEAIAPIPLVDCRTALLPTAQINWAEIRAESASTICVLSKLKPSEEAAMMRPLIAQMDCRVGYLRHPSFADLDPLEAAINTVCNGELLSNPARAEDLQDLDGLIVLSPAGDNSLASEALRLRGLAGIALPILHVTPPKSSGPAVDVPIFEEISYPVTLKRLARFVSMLKPNVPASSM